MVRNIPGNGGFAGWFVGGPLGSLLGPNRSMIFCAAAAALLAKIAKADGFVTSSEISVIERAYLRLGFSPAARDYAIGVFRRAKDDRHTVCEYAQDFARAVPSMEIRELLYEILWDVACADGRIDPGELAVLRQLPLPLGIRSAWFDMFARERIRGRGDMGRPGREVPSSRDSLADAYLFLGADPDDDDAALRNRYRELVKKYHPDALRAQGLPDEMIGKANERMARINAAWTEIRSARGL